MKIFDKNKCITSFSEKKITVSCNVLHSQSPGCHGEYKKNLAIKLESKHAKLAIDHFPYLSGECKQYYGRHRHLYVKYTKKSPNPFHIDNMETQGELRHTIGYLGYDITIYQSAERFHSHYGNVQHRVK